jgi:5-methylcytosine-specific restriction enzyme subunit McrC
MPDKPQPADRMIGRIPVRNLWLLMLYASELTQFRGDFKAIVEGDIDDLPDLVGRLLADAVERRIRRNLTRGYLHRESVLKRVRGRIDILTTATGLLLWKGEVACRFEDLTIDTMRNRQVRAALDLMARLVKNAELFRRCRFLASTLGRAGVGGVRPSRAELATDYIGRNDSADGFMVALARLAFDLGLPTEESGVTPFVAPDQEKAWVRRLFEKAVLGFARFELEPLGWNVRGGMTLNWQVQSESEGLAAILPRMVTDIVLDPPGGGRRVVIDTKFTSVLTSGRFGQAGLKSGYLYQMYAYVRSQEGRGPQWHDVDGLFLHPAISGIVREQVVIQNHSISFATVDLAGGSEDIRRELRGILKGMRSPA